MSHHQRPGRCRGFGTRGGCRFGDRCRFSHDRGGSASLRGSPSPATSPALSRSQTPLPVSPPSQNRAPAGVPRNVCQFFWSTGSCARNFECNYRHVKQTGASEPPSTAVGNPQGEEDVDFFSPDGLARNVGSVREDRFNLNPSEVHNHLRDFTRDRYRFDNAAQIQGFVKILGSVNDGNKNWVCASFVLILPQEFLDVVVKGNALHRIGEVLRFEPVRSSIGYGSCALSFQRAYIPLFQFFASDLILKTTMHKNINHLYAIIKHNHEHIFSTLRTCLTEMMAVRSWADTSPNLLPSLQNSIDGILLFRTLSTVLLQYITRYRDVARNHADVAPFVQDFADWFDSWSRDVSSSPPRFADSIAQAPSRHRELGIAHVREDVRRLQEIVQRESGAVQRLRPGPARSSLTLAQRSQAMAAQLAQTYIPPGALRPEGPRHDNDFTDIEDIRIAPTHEELFSPVLPYLPVFRSDAPHHLPMGSMERLLDIQFRLLREDLISTTRSSMAAIQDDLTIAWNRNGKRTQATKLEEVIQKNGGAYRTSGYDSVFFQLYTNVEFHKEPPMAQRRGVTVTLVLDAPAAGSARDKDAKKRYDYWEYSKRLQGSTLVALVVVSNRTVKAYLGVVASYGKDIAESAKRDKDRIQLKVAFFDADVELMALRGEQLSKGPSSFAILVDNSVMFESVRPFLEKLKTIEPTEIPFARYIAPGESVKDVQVLPPKYARVPAFRFRLQCLAKPGKVLHDLDVLNPAAVARAREELKKDSVLDPSQAEAVVDTLVKEVSLIQGPPGTGKSYTAKEILRVLFSSKIKPIVLIAFTNHALDHMLTSVLDAGITDNVVRLGTRSSDERISQYTLDKLEKVAATAQMDRAFKRQYAIMKKLEEQMSKVMTSIRLPLVSWDTIETYLDIHYPEHADAFRTPPFWIWELSKLMWAEEELEGEWQEAKRKGSKKTKTVDSSVSRTAYGFWRAGKDLQFLQTPPRQASQAGKGKEVMVPAPDADNIVVSLLSNPVGFFEHLGFGGMMPPLPTSDRPLPTLQRSANVWAMSSSERARLADDWEQKIRRKAYESQLSHYNALRDEYKEACKDHEDMRDENRRRLLRRSDLIACTTTGAASLTSLLASVAPKVLLVEEAGQVLEAHILTSLVPSVQHLICIGDPQQLRPTLATFSLSMDSARGRELFMFDRSLMERLVNNGFQMSQLNVQRRMRPTISHFIRTILYPKLEDNAIVKEYPPVQGMQKDVLFFDHLNKEGGSDDSVSKYNMFEVQMIRDLVVYFLRQGRYSGPGDIAVLCAYLGQLQKVRAALRDLKIAVAVDERDAEQLARQGIDEEINFEQVLVARHVRLGTVDIFQGQEAKIVIVSLVRNSGQCDTGSASIGFLKSSNRINVALSRAKHGLYIMGNAANLRANTTWATILDEMENRDQLATSFPIACPRHPEQSRLISKPGELPLASPAGGCLLPCGFRMNCGHICPSACHAAPDNHRSMKCVAPCNRTPCPRRHPCSRKCYEDCGRCQFPIYNVTLPCGHVEAKVPCCQLEDLASVKCGKMVRKSLPTCEHYAMVACHRDPATVQCKAPCKGIMECCSKQCKSSCGSCQALSTPLPPAQGQKNTRTKHNFHPCERLLYCQHQCALPCSQEHECNTKCQSRCRQECMHHRCPRPCSEPCAPCMEPCTWSCAHFSCPVVCGSICSRLPCDEPCGRTLSCGHTCPSVCGEPCEKQTCVLCLNQERRADIVDFIMQRRLEEIDLDSADVSDRLITLDCGHIFTVETLDGHCGMHDYYVVDEMGRYVRMRSPPVKYQTPPTCPTCRGPITALRYGRVTKRATLDILEQNVASSMSGSLDACSPDVSRLSADLSTMQEQAKKLVVMSPIEYFSSDEEKTPKQIPEPDQGPLRAEAWNQVAMRTIHGLSEEEARDWNAIVKDILVTYRKVARVANTRGAHVKAYESALSTLFRIEMQAIANDPARATDAPEPLALAIVDQKIGQPRPKADVRFQVEAFFLTLELRSLVARVAESRMEGLSTLNDGFGDDYFRLRAVWTSFVKFLYKSCITDAHKAKALAAESFATQQEARAALFVIRFEFELFRWRKRCKHARLCRDGKYDEPARNALSGEVRRYKDTLDDALDLLRKEYMRKRPSKTMEDVKAERAWIAENCGQKVDAWKQECDVLEEFLVKGGFYQPVSLQERADIVKAFSFSHRGHFYNCENGHTFVITECGGAMETARCPECRAPIGGSSHNLLSSNTMATEFEDLARRHGSADPHWPWARGA
ncbi:hypothetical protein FKP32DRAFT_1561707 [Trametes sanguinea]|nr:hypothetical protein FKP32DRAFT_1561707 [Trametes sanguinea]